MADLHDVADYLIIKCSEGGVSLNLLKLQKLLYYCQAWNLALDRGRLFAGEFQAWVHGPVNRVLYDRFSFSKSLYSPVGPRDVKRGFDGSRIAPPEKELIDAVLNVYGGYTGDQLEAMTHNEEPWIKARGGISPMDRCENTISEDLMAQFYKARLKDKQ